MWISFFVAVIVGLAVLYVPGYFLVRGLRASHIVSVVCAPLVTLAVYSVLALVYFKLGIFCTVWLLVLPPTMLGMALCGFSLFRAGAFEGRERAFGCTRHAASASEVSAVSRTMLGWPGLALYVFLGVVITLYVLVFNMESPDSVIQYYDNLHHVGAIGTFVTSGNWSSFNSTLYATPADAAINPLGDGGFYPSAWHSIAAAMVGILGVSAPLAENADVVVFAAVVFPASMFLLMRKLFSEKPSVVFFGAFATMAFAVFPWRFITFGPLFPNLAALALLPALLYCFIKLFDRGIGRSPRIVSGAVFAAGIVGIAFTQPNAIFSAGVFLAPFCVYQAGRIADVLQVSDSKRRAARVGFCVAAALLIGLIWFACFKLPFLQSVVSYTWPPYTGKLQAVQDIAQLWFTTLPAQQFLAVVVAAGALLTLRKRKYFWITCSYVFACLLYVVAASFDGPLKHFLTGFWYTDPYRVAAHVVLAGIPLASFALGSLSDAVVYRLKNRVPARALGLGISCCIALVFTVVNYYPQYAITGSVDDKSAFDVAGKYVREGFGNSQYGYYDAQERDFVKQAQAIVPPDALIVNMPADGSALAYSIDGLRVYYRYYGADGDESGASSAIRNNLCNVATDEAVQKAVVEVGAQYVLLLDANPDDRSGVYDFWARWDIWQGIWSINDDTPGFEVVLSEGDMRLYKITAA